MVPWSVVTEYCDRLDLDDDQRERMYFHLRRLCEVAAEHARKKNG